MVKGSDARQCTLRERERYPLGSDYRCAELAGPCGVPDARTVERAMAYYRSRTDGQRRDANERFALIVE